MGLGFALVLLYGKIRLPAILEKVLVVVAIGSWLGRIVTLMWARAEFDFLTRPDKEPPLDIFKDKP